jgi:hypothetical protein
MEYQSGDVEAQVYARDLISAHIGVVKIRSRPNSFPLANAFGLFIATSARIDIDMLSNLFEGAGLQFSRMHLDLTKHLPLSDPAPNI